MYSKISSGTLLGVKAMLIDVEVDVSSGLPMFAMVGCAGSEVRESKERIWAAFKNADLPMPVSRITVNLSPADLHKEGTSFDLPIAIGIMESSGAVPEGSSKHILFLGELGLTGEIRPVRGVLPIVTEAKKRGIRECIISKANAVEGAIVPGMTIRGAENICQVTDYLNDPDDKKLPPEENNPVHGKSGLKDAPDYDVDFSDVNVAQVVGAFHFQTALNAVSRDE